MSLLSGGAASTAGLSSFAAAKTVALSAGVGALESAAVISLISNKGDFGAMCQDLVKGKTLRSVATSMLTAGLTAGFANALNINTDFSLSESLDLPGRIEKACLDLAVGTTVNVVKGDDLDEALTGAFKSSLANLTQSVLAAQIGKWYHGKTDHRGAAAAGASDSAGSAGDGSGSAMAPRFQLDQQTDTALDTFVRAGVHKLMHGAAGAVSGLITNNDALSGAIGAVVGEIIAEQVADAYADDLQAGANAKAEAAFEASHTADSGAGSSTDSGAGASSSASSSAAAAAAAAGGEDATGVKTSSRSAAIKRADNIKRNGIALAKMSAVLVAGAFGKDYELAAQTAEIAAEENSFAFEAVTAGSLREDQFDIIERSEAIIEALEAQLAKETAPDERQNLQDMLADLRHQVDAARAYLAHPEDMARQFQDGVEQAQGAINSVTIDPAMAALGEFYDACEISPGSFLHNLIMGWNGIIDKYQGRVNIELAIAAQHVPAIYQDEFVTEYGNPLEALRLPTNFVDYGVIAATSGVAASGAKQIAGKVLRRTGKALGVGTNSTTIPVGELKIQRNRLGRVTGVEKTQVHHIVHQKLKHHPLWEKAGMNVEAVQNKMLLPTVDGAKLSTTTRSIHQGRHFDKVTFQLEKEMTAVLQQGQRLGYSQAQYRSELVAIMQQEQKILKSGQRALNKHQRPWSDQ